MPLKRSILSAVMLLLLSCAAYAQEKEEYEKYMESAGNASLLYRGRLLSEYNFPHNGTFYWTSPEYEEGELFYNGKYYDGLLLNIDAHQQNLICRLPENAFQRVLERNEVEWFRKGSSRYVNAGRMGYDTAPEGFFEVCRDGRFKLLRQVVKELKKDNDGTLASWTGYDGVYSRSLHETFVINVSYYVAGDGFFVKLKRKRDIYALFPEKKKALRNYMLKVDREGTLPADRFFATALDYLEAQL